MLGISLLLVPRKRKTWQLARKPMTPSLRVSHFLICFGRSIQTWCSILAAQKRLKRVFKDAIDSCGMDYRSDELWSRYIEYETKHNNFKEAMMLYNRVLNIPTLRYQTHFERCKILISTRSPVEFLTMEELSAIYTRIQAENDNYQVAMEDLPSDDIADSLTEADVQKIRQHFLDTREQMFLLNEMQVQKRSAFEDGIKRLYFFSTPLNIKQLQNWRKYLTFEMSQGLHDRIVVLFERCLMPCAMYEEFWLSYAQYMEGQSVEAARSVFERACLTHLPLKFTLHHQWAFFEEKHGELDSARAILHNLENVLPGVVLVRLRRVNFERRNGNLQEAERLLREAVQISGRPGVAAFYTVKLARLLLKLKKDPEKARDLLMEALKKEPNSPCLHECLLEIEISRDGVDDVMHCVERALKSNIHDALKGTLSQKRLEFLEDNGTSIKSLLNAYDEHQILLKNNEMKRKGNDGDEGDEKNKKAKAQSDNPSVQDNPSTPGVSQPTGSAVASSLVMTQSVPTNNTSTTVSSTQKTNVKVPNVPKPIKPEPNPPARAYVPSIQPYFPHPSPQPVPLYSPIFRGPFPPQRMPFPQHYMRGPPGPMPFYNYGPWHQNFGGYNNPQPWNCNRFYQPF
ncbi:pre-mRNA-processing factor 39-like isoform X2 [Phyllobates terribilis]|uniref:pre-mRNA-processing factor 39-like isoform X2 n=1 Tax=Phyllobates terribilis TaxID=111132 RepID=UPI003CCA9336